MRREPRALLTAALLATASAAGAQTENCAASYLPQEMGVELGIDQTTWNAACARGLSREQALAECLRVVAERRKAAAPADAPTAPPKASARSVFDGQARRPALSPEGRDADVLARYAAADRGGVNLCDGALLENPSLPRWFVGDDPRVLCAPRDGGAASALFRRLAGEPRALRTFLARWASDAPSSRAEIREFYERVRQLDARGAAAAPAPGWAWTLALETAGRDPLEALRVIGFCGRNDGDPGELLSPLSPREARDAMSSVAELLSRRIASRGGRPGPRADDPTSADPAALRANDDAADRERLAALRVEAFAAAREKVCPGPDSVFYKPGGLGAAAEPPEAARRRRAAVSGAALAPALQHRVYAAALLGCELARAGAPAETAAALPANAAWARRLLQIREESRVNDRLRAGPGLERRLRLAALTAPPEEAPSAARVDAFLLLKERGYPGRMLAEEPSSADGRAGGWLVDGRPRTSPAGWSAARARAAEGALKALLTEWEWALAQRDAGARFGADVCAAGAGAPAPPRN
jgi:hypothetical protein